MSTVKSVRPVRTAGSLDRANRPSSRWQPLIPTRKFAQSALIVLVGTAALVVLWQLGVSIFRPSTTILPGPIAVAQAFGLSADSIGKASVSTLQEAAIGLAIGIAVAVPGGVLFGVWRPAYQVIYPFIVWIHSVPKIALAPVLVLAFGFGPAPRIILCVLVTFFPILVNTIAGVQSTPPALLDLCKVIKLGRGRTVLIRLTSALPQVFTGIKVGASVALIGAIAGEFVGGHAGLGYLLIASMGVLNGALGWAVIVLLGLYGVALYFIAELVERLMIPWSAGVRNRERLDAASTS